MFEVIWAPTNMNKAVHHSKEKKLHSQGQLTLQNFNYAGVNMFPWFVLIKEIKADMGMFKYYRSTGVLSWRGYQRKVRWLNGVELVKTKCTVRCLKSLNILVLWFGLGLFSIYALWEITISVKLCNHKKCNMLKAKYNFLIVH